MAAIVGLTGDVVSWGTGGDFVYNLVGSANGSALLKPAKFDLNFTGAEHDTTSFNAGAAVVETALPGLRGWEGTIEGYQTTATVGLLGSVSGAAYTTNVRSWSMRLEAAEHDTTAWPITSNWMTYAPGLVKVSGSYEALIDSSTSIALPDTTAQAATFTLTTSNTWAVSIFATRIGAAVNVGGGVSTVRYDYRGTGNVVVTGSNAVMPATSTQATPVAATLLLKAHEAGASDKTYSGSAFWKSISVDVSPGAATKAVIAFRGTGALTTA